MWQDILNIHDDCEEEFLNFEQLPGKAEKLIACAGLSTLKTEYQIGNTGSGERLSDTDKVHVHYVICTHGGLGKIKLADAEYIIEPNSIVLIPAGCPFLYELAGDYWDMCWLLLHDCAEYQFIHQLTAGVYKSDDAKLVYQTMSLLSEFTHNKGHSQSDITLRLVEVLIFQIEQTLNKESHLSNQQVRFKKLMQKVNKQLHISWTVGDLAQAMHISEPQFFRLCKKETGLTPIKLLTGVRLEYACHLLRYTNYNLEQIAYTIGYADGASFAHRFKLNYEISPGQWRLKN